MRSSNRFKLWSVISKVLLKQMSNPHGHDALFVSQGIVSYVWHYSSFMAFALQGPWYRLCCVRSHFGLSSHPKRLALILGHPGRSAFAGLVIFNQYKQRKEPNFMGARQKLNDAHVNGALIAAGVLGLMTGSWVIFIIAGAALIGAATCNGDIRPKSRS